MEREPRQDKVAIVDEVKAKLDAAEAVIVTEYRGLKVGDLAKLRGAIRGGGGEYRVFKNTLVRRAAQALELDLDDVLVGPVGLVFVNGDVAAVAKALRDFSKENPALVVKGGVLNGTVLDTAQTVALASLPTASEVYARLAGALNFGARGTATVLHGVHRSLAYVLQAAIDADAFAGEPAAA